MGREQLAHQIRAAFADVAPPPNWSLTEGTEGPELLVAQEFQDKSDWRTLEPSFLSGAPQGYSSALNFFSAEALRFYLPAYMLADLDKKLDQVDLVFHLCHNLQDASKATRINERRYGERTWFDHAQFRFSVFTAREVAAIVEFLETKNTSPTDTLDGEMIAGALANYWLPRAHALLLRGT